MKTFDSILKTKFFRILLIVVGSSVGIFFSSIAMDTGFNSYFVLSAVFFTLSLVLTYRLIREK